MNIGGRDLAVVPISAAQFRREIIPLFVRLDRGDIAAFVDLLHASIGGAVSKDWLLDALPGAARALVPLAKACSSALAANLVEEAGLACVTRDSAARAELLELAAEALSVRSLRSMGEELAGLLLRMWPKAPEAQA